MKIRAKKDFLDKEQSLKLIKEGTVLYVSKKRAKTLEMAGVVEVLLEPDLEEEQSQDEN